MTTYTKEEIIKIRNEYGMSRTQFAKEVLNIPYSTLEKWETGAVTNIPAIAHTAYRLLQKQLQDS